MSETLIKVQGVSKKFCRSLKKSLWYGMQDLGREITGRKHGGNGELRPDEFWAVKDVSFELKRGECLGLIGHNGAGKTTLLKMLNGLIKPDAGSLTMRGRVGALIALGAGFNPILTGRENIYVNGAVLGLNKREIDEKLEEIIEFAEISDFIDAPVQSYSSGMAVRLGFAIAAKTEPDILLLDEVLAVGDVGFQAKCFNTIAEFRERGTAFILVSHNMHQITRHSDRVLYLNHGSIAHLGDLDTGIGHFLSDMHNSDASSASEMSDWSRVYGSGKIVLTGARFLNKDENEITAIDVGDQVTLEIDYERRMEIGKPPVFDVVIRDREGMVYQGTNVKDKFPFATCEASKGKFSVSFASMPTNTDYLDFFVAILDSETNEVFDWKRHIRLLVRRSGSQNGRLHLQACWKMTAQIPN